MSRLFADEDFPLPVTDALRKLGHDVLTIQQAGHAGQETPDEQVLLIATRDRRAVLTANRWDFVRLHRMNSQHSGIITCTFDPDSDALAVRIHERISQASDLSGQLLRVNKPA